MRCDFQAGHSSPRYSVALSNGTQWPLIPAEDHAPCSIAEDHESRRGRRSGSIQFMLFITEKEENKRETTSQMPPTDLIQKQIWEILSVEASSTHTYGDLPLLLKT